MPPRFEFSKFARRLLTAAVLAIVSPLPTFAHDGETHASNPLEGLVEDAEQAIDRVLAPVPGVRQRVVTEGVSVEFDIRPLDGDAANRQELVAGQDATISFRIADASTGAPLSGVYPAAWMDSQKTGREDLSCREKIKGFVQGGMGYRAQIDLNLWYALVLNEDPSITVIDPLLGFGMWKTMAMPKLAAAGEDWVLSRNQNKVYVTMPSLGQVAVVDTGRWSVVANIDVGPNPGRIALQPDEKYLWVSIDAGFEGDDARGGVVVVERNTLEVAGRVRTGAGHHELAFDDDHFAAATNTADGTVTMVDTNTLTKVADVEIGGHPVAIAYSELSRAFYVADVDEGAIVVIDGRTHEIRARFDGGAGLSTVAIAPGGRWGFAANTAEDRVHVFDTSMNRIVDSIEVESRPYSIAFSEAFAYVRSAGSEHVTMIPLDALGKGGRIPSQTITGGRKALETAMTLEGGAAIMPTPDGVSVLINSPADREIYYYMEGMAAPMGSFSNEQHKPRGVMVVDKSIRETAPGTYSRTVRLPGEGTYDVAFFLDTPGVWHCFTAAVGAEPDAKKTADADPQVEFLLESRELTVKQETKLRFKITDGATGAPRTDFGDIRVITLLAPGAWQTRHWAEAVGDGVYEVSLSPPKAGAYYIFLESRSLGLRYHKTPFVTLLARDRGEG